MRRTSRDPGLGERLSFCRLPIVAMRKLADFADGAELDLGKLARESVG
jgi:hypothetical protein